VPRHLGALNLCRAPHAPRNSLIVPQALRVPHAGPGSIQNQRYGSPVGDHNRDNAPMPGCRAKRSLENIEAPTDRTMPSVQMRVGSGLWIGVSAAAGH
jgi:hypothetical protein